MNIFTALGILGVLIGTSLYTVSVNNANNNKMHIPDEYIPEEEEKDAYGDKELYEEEKVYGKFNTR